MGRTVRRFRSATRRSRWLPALALAAIGVLAEPLPARSADPVGAAWGAEADPIAGESAPRTPVGAGGPSGPGSTSDPIIQLERAWRSPGVSLERRVFEARRRSFEMGAWNLGAAARALLASADAGSPLERARAAVALAPDLPAAHMALAFALWLEGEDPLAALRSIFAAGAAATRHVEASFWFGGSLLYVLAVALVGGGILTLLLVGLGALPRASHDLGHWVRAPSPAFAGPAVLAALVLLPLALGEGLLGLALALGAVAGLVGARAHRVALALAAASVALGAYPVAHAAGAILEAFPLDPVARAAYSLGEGLATPVEIDRLEAHAADDPLAARALANRARRHGRLAEADTLYQELIGAGATDVSTLNNAANVRLELGHLERAIALYHQALDRRESPVVLFNLAQAYGRGFQVEDLNRTFAHAQRVGGDFVASLTALQGTDTKGFVVDFPLGAELFWARALRPGAGSAIAAELRGSVAPGRLGRDPRWLAGSALAAVVFGALLGGRFSGSRGCSRCGVRVCARCDPQRGRGDLCPGCQRLFHQPEKTDRALRIERVRELQLREQRLARAGTALSVLMPGAAGLLVHSPLRCWLGAFCFALGACAWLWRGGVVPDPGVAGAAGPAAFAAVVGLAALGYSLAVTSALAIRRRGA